MRNSRLFFLSLIPIGKGRMDTCKMLPHKIILIWANMKFMLAGHQPWRRVRKFCWLKNVLYRKIPFSVMLFHRHSDVYTEFICLNAGFKSKIWWQSVWKRVCFCTLFFLCGSYWTDAYIAILFLKIELIIYHKEKGRLNISDGLCFEASISYQSVSNVDQGSQYGYCGSNDEYH